MYLMTAILFTTMICSVATAGTGIKLSDRVLAAVDYPRILWVYVDSQAVADTPVELSARALARREKAGITIDEYDYPISAAALAEIEATGAKVRHASRWLRAVAVIASAEQLAAVVELSFVTSVDLVNKLAAAPPVLNDEPSRAPVPLSAAEADYGASLLQNQMIRSVKLHDAGLTGAGVLIAILDTGFDVDHPALAEARENIVATWDFISGDTVVNERDCPDGASDHYQNIHGTYVWGAIGGYVPDTLIGVAAGAEFALAKTEISCSGTEILLEEDNWIAAAEWADSLGADIITSSLGYYLWDDAEDYEFEDLNGDSALITRAADMAAAKNILVITSAGNERRSATWPYITMPADGDSVIAVGATYDDSTITTFSSPGPTADGRIKPDVATLGYRVYTARAESSGGYAYVDGTSLSAPLVAGGAALAMEQNPHLSAFEIAQRIRMSADRADNPDNDYGYGMFDAYKTADFVRFEEIPTIQLRSGQPPETTLVTTLGGGAAVPTIFGIDLPDWVTVIDRQDGTALLVAEPGADNPIHSEAYLVADIGIVADTVGVSFESIGSSSEAIFAGPNPFCDTVTVFAAPEAGRITGVSVLGVHQQIWVICRCNNRMECCNLERPKSATI